MATSLVIAPARNLNSQKSPTHKIKEPGGAKGDRTPDLGIANAALSQLSYRPSGGNKLGSVRTTRQAAPLHSAHRGTTWGHNLEPKNARSHLAHQPTLQSLLVDHFGLRRLKLVDPVWHRQRRQCQCAVNSAGTPPDDGACPRPHPPPVAKSRRPRHFTDHRTDRPGVHSAIGRRPTLPLGRVNPQTSPLRQTGRGLALHVKATPKARHNEIGQPVRMPDGTFALPVKVTAPPEDGKANAAIVALLAKSAGVAKSSFVQVAGETHRNKIFHIEANQEDVVSWLARLQG
jgi:uncharacterized protein YggU (UPF0235/DUF167 family)